MQAVERLTFLKSEGILPADSKVISTHNNLVVVSDSEDTVARISTIHQIKSRRDPGDLIYSHRMSNDIGHEGAVLSPIDKEPITFGENIISRYPRMQIPDWSNITGDELVRIVHKLNGFPYRTGVSNSIAIRKLDVASYVQDRLNSLDDSTNIRSVAYVKKMLAEYCANYSFTTATGRSDGLVHGDMHSGNVVSDEGELLFIDLDSIAVGPREYDLASWCVRSMRGDTAPAVEATAISIDEGLSSEDRIRSMVGWKVLSSMSHELVYNPVNSESEVGKLARIAEELDAPGDWSSHNV